MKPKNFELLGRKWEYMSPVPETLEYWSQTDKRLSVPFNHNCRSARIREKLFYPVLDVAAHAIETKCNQNVTYFSRPRASFIINEVQIFFSSSCNRL